MELKNNAQTLIHSDNILELITDKREFDVPWFADAHLDSKKSKRKFIKRLIDENPDAFIVYGGDCFDLMQGKKDRRAEKSALGDEFSESDYWNRVIDYSRDEWLYPYKDRIIAFIEGNHTTGVLSHNEIDFLGWLTDSGKLANRMYAAGWIILTMKIAKGRNLCFPVYFQHAPPSGGKRSKGMLSVDILLGEHPDAKAIITEHIHETYITPQTVERLNVRAKTVQYNNVWCLQAPTTKAEHEGKKRGYYHERVKKSATSIGALKLSFKYKRYQEDNKETELITLDPKYELLYE